MVGGLKLVSLFVDLWVLLVESGSLSIGIRILNVVPWLVVVLNFIPLLCFSKIVLTTERPKPVPLPSSLVVKKGSKILSFIEGSIPIPLSETLK